MTSCACLMRSELSEPYLSAMPSATSRREFQDERGTIRLPDEERLTYIQHALFARANDARVWLQGWYANLAGAQIMAANMINGEFFKRAGGIPFLLIQAAVDFGAPPDRAERALMVELGDQVSYVEIPDTGHALSADRPDVIAKLIINYFSE